MADVPENSVNPSDNNEGRMESMQRLSMMMASIEGDVGVADKMTSEHITELLSQKRQVNEYIYKERMRNYSKYKLTFVGGLIFSGALVFCVLFFRPDYFAEVLSALFGVGGGFGLAKFTQSDS